VIGQNIRERRISLDLSQAGLAQELAVVTASVVSLDPSAVGRVESGERGLDAVELLAMARVFHVEPGELLVPTEPLEQHITALADTEQQIRELERQREWHERSIRALSADDAPETPRKRGS
jgi:transcriptional regulator with XRE-family HTH domain